MIRKLKVRIAVLVVLGLVLSSVVLVYAIHRVNLRTIDNQMRSVLNVLMVNDGKRPVSWAKAGPGAPEGAVPAEQGGPAATVPPRPEGMSPAAAGESGGLPPRDGLPAAPGNERGTDVRSIADLSNYYLVRLQEDGTVASLESDRSDLYTDEEMSETVAEILASGNAFGRKGNAYYLRQDSLLIVLDATIDLKNAENFLRTAAVIALIQILVLSAGAVFLIRRLVKPVDEAVEKQKQFVWDASHELKTPLAVISANAEVLAGEIGPNPSLTYIRNEVERTDRLVQDLLSLARMEKSGTRAAFERIDLSETLLSVALPFESVVYEQGKKFETDIPEGIDCTGNAEMIKELAMILLSNALKYSDGGGTIRLSLAKQGEKRCFSVFNTGEAIPPEAQKHLFDRFYRVESSRSRELGGNGLGLALAKAIADEHHAKIQVRSAQGAGTAFTVVLPR